MTAHGLIRAASLVLATFGVTIGVTAGTATPAGARPMLFVDAPEPYASSRAIVSLESAWEDHGIRAADERAAINRLGVQLPLGARWDGYLRVESTIGRRRSMNDVDFQGRWTAGRGRADGALLSLRAGARRESSGTTVLLGGIAASKRVAASLAAASLDLERALGPDRDDVDILTSAGWTTPVGPILRLGVEASGQDLEGLWERNEAEGGAVLFLGPTVAVNAPGSSWRFALGGGPVFHVTRSPLTSLAPRDILPRGDGYALRLVIENGDR